MYSNNYINCSDGYMSVSDIFGTRVIQGGPDPMPPGNNDNMRLLAHWQTPAEFLQWVRQDKVRLQRELLANPDLLASPEHRLSRQIRVAMEKVCLWQYFGSKLG